MRKIIALLLLLFPLAALAQEVKMPQSVKLTRGRMVSIELTHDGDDFKWSVPSELDVFRGWSDDPKTVVLLVMAPLETRDGTYQIFAVCTKVVEGKAKLSPFQSCLVQVGLGPGPGPLPPPDPTPPPPPPPDPTPAGRRQVTVIYESQPPPGEASPVELSKWGETTTLLRRGPSHDYLLSRNHVLTVLDVDSLGADGRPSTLVEAWKPFIAGLKLPVVVLVDMKTNNIIHKQSLSYGTSDVEIVNLVKAHGG